MLEDKEPTDVPTWDNNRYVVETINKWLQNFVKNEGPNHKIYICICQVEVQSNLKKVHMNSGSR